MGCMLCCVYGKPLRIEICKQSDHCIPLSVWQVNDPDIKKMVEYDLDSCGAFRVLQPGDMVGDDSDQLMLVSGQVHDNKDLVIKGLVQNANDMNNATHLDDVSAPNKRVLAHRFANSIHKALLGYDGHFEQHIVYRVEQVDGSGRRTFRLARCDSDGENCIFLTDKSQELRTHCADPKSGRIAYVCYSAGATNLFVYDPETNKSTPIPLPPGVPIAPRFSPCGTELTFSLARCGMTSLYTHRFSDRKTVPCTSRRPHIDVSPTYAPDGQSFVFVSDRNGGRVRLYMHRPGQKEALLSKGTGSYFAPSWSADGQWIAFVKRRPDGYYLGVMASDGTQERLIAKDHVIDTPSWSANGRMILFSAQQRRFGPVSIYLIDRTGRTVRKIPLSANGRPHNGSGAVWSR